VPDRDRNGTEGDGVELVDLLVDQFALLYEADPLNPVVAVVEDLLTFTFSGGLLPADELLLRSERAGRAAQFRSQALELIAEQMRDIVEGLVGRKVLACDGVFDSETWISSCSFTLGEQTPADAEERRALRSWSRQVIRNSQTQRAERSETLARQRDLTAALKKTRGELRHRDGKTEGDPPSSR
jgi:uncharacterized protein YbcI